MSTIERKLGTLIAAYNKLIRGIDNEATLSHDRAYGGIIRAGKGSLVESMTTHLVQIAWEDVLQQSMDRMEINKHRLCL